MRIFAVTGPVDLAVGQANVVRQAIYDLAPTARELVSGCAFGVDTLAAESMLLCNRDCQVRLVVPAAPCNFELVAAAGDRGWTVEHAPECSSPSEAYMARNDLLVERGIDGLVAFPSSPREQVRSGTWSTVRRARTAGRLVMVFPLDGSAPWTESSLAR